MSLDERLLEIIDDHIWNKYTDDKALMLAIKEAVADAMPKDDICQYHLNPTGVNCGRCRDVNTRNKALSDMKERLK